jgi:hypothetical protein
MCYITPATRSYGTRRRRGQQLPSMRLKVAGLLRGHGPSLAPVASGRAARDQEAVIVGVFAVALTRRRIHMPDAPWPGTAQKIR